MEIKIFFDKSVEENANIYYDKAKKLKGKVDGVINAIDLLKNKIEESKIQEEKQKLMKNTKKDWYEKFRWFYTSNNLLCVAGRSAETNESLIKKHMEKDDLVFHTDMPGSPFGLIKNGQRNAKEQDIQEMGNFIASFSKAWKRNLLATEVFYVTPNQVSKEAKAGEYLTKGSFMIYGKKNFVTGKLDLAVSKMHNKITCAPLSSIKYDKYIKIVPGTSKVSSVAKKVMTFFDYPDLDEIIRILPSDLKIAKEKK